MSSRYINYVANDMSTNLARKMKGKVIYHECGLSTISTGYTIYIHWYWQWLNSRSFFHEKYWSCLNVDTMVTMVTIMVIINIAWLMMCSWRLSFNGDFKNGDSMRLRSHDDFSDICFCCFSDRNSCCQSIWVNYNNQLTWIVRPFWDNSPY